jgi:hypothetical protein
LVRDFQDGKLKGLAITIGAGREGITLTRAAHSLFVDLDWSPGINCQAEDRICRIGQNADKVQIIRMVSNHSMDKHILSLLTSKMEMINAAIENEIKISTPDANKNGIELIEETDEDFAARMALINAVAIKAERERILGKVGTKLETMRRKSGSWKAPKMSKKVRKDLASAWSMMLGMCDGAKTKDGIGFNKPDASVAHWTMRVLDDEAALELAWLMLRKYDGQLSGTFPSLYPKHAA